MSDKDFFSMQTKQHFQLSQS